MSAHPVLVRDGQPKALIRIRLTPKGEGEVGAYDERWLQALIQRCPELLPMAEIEPGLRPLIPIAMEAACSHGIIDNLFITSRGDIAIVETKLWRNPEARRQVVTQALDYAAALARMRYEDFERCALSGKIAGVTPASLYSMIGDMPDALDEPKFIEAVSNNLRRGRMVIIAASDGIRVETEALADLLQSHAGARFTFALVAIELFKCADGAVLAVPAPVLKTQIVERGVVDIRNEQIVVEPAPQVMGMGKAIRSNLTEDQFFEAMRQRSPALPNVLRPFLDRLRALGVETHWGTGLILRWTSDPRGSITLAYVPPSGEVKTDSTSYTLTKYEPGLDARYLEKLAKLIGGRVRKTPSSLILDDANGRIPKIETLLPAYADGWIAAIAALIEEVRKSDES